MSGWGASAPCQPLGIHGSSRSAGIIVRLLRGMWRQDFYWRPVIADDSFDWADREHGTLFATDRESNWT